MKSVNFDYLFQRYKNVTRRSHYVQRKYLERWRFNKKSVFLVKDKTKFTPVQLTNICVQNEMYKIGSLSPSEIRFLKTIIKTCYHPENWKPLCEFVDKWQNLNKILEEIKEKGDNLKQLGNNIQIQKGEDLQSLCENLINKEIQDALYNFSDSFLTDENLEYTFAFFLFSQYLRTAFFREKVCGVCHLSETKESDGLINIVHPESIWNILIFIFSINSASTFVKGDKHHICFVRNKDKSFFTSDNPFVNLAENIDKDLPVFFYPFSPEIGLIYPTSSFAVKEDKKLCQYLNQKTINNKTAKFLIAPPSIYKVDK